MTEPPAGRGVEPDNGEGAAQGGPPRVPDWVKVSGIIVIIVIVALVAIMLISGGEHGPGRHSAVAPGQTERSALTDDRVVVLGSSELGNR